MIQETEISVLVVSLKVISVTVGTLGVPEEMYQRLCMYIVLPLSRSLSLIFLSLPHTHSLTHIHTHIHFTEGNISNARYIRCP